MVHLWGTRPKEGAEISQSALGGDVPGDVAVVLGGQSLDIPLVFLASRIAKGAHRRLRLLYIITVPRVQPLTAVLPKESERADAVLNAAFDVTKQVQCEAVAEIVQTRSAGSSIVDEAKDRGWSLVFLGLSCDSRTQALSDYLGQTVPYVLAHAPCRVWLVHDPPRTW